MSDDIEKLEKVEEISLLLDFYGELLSEKQLQILKLYHEENCSLTEIAEDLEISKQAVSDSVKKSEKALYDYEDKMHLVLNFKQNRALVEEILEDVKSIEENDPQLAESIRKLALTIDRPKIGDYGI